MTASGPPSPEARRVGRGTRGLRAALALTLLGVGSSGAAPTPAVAMGPPISGAELVADHAGRPWALQAGVYGQAADITAAPDGSLYVLDRRNRAVHRLTPFGAVRSVQAIPAELLVGAFEPRRIDAGPQGLYLLALNLEASRVIRLDAAGGPSVAFQLPLRYNDLACLPSGELLLSRSVVRDGPTPVPRDPRAPVRGGVDRFALTGQLLGELPPEPLAAPIGVDAAADGRIFVINRVPVPDAPSATEPPATQEPSRGPHAAPQGRHQAMDPINGIVRYDAAARYLDTVPFVAAEDVAAGPGDAYVSRQLEVYRLGEALPIWGPASAQVIVPSAGATILRIAQPWTGGRRLHASLSHCHAQGVLSFDLALPGSEPRLDGGLDHPPLQGPILPLRMAASAEGPLLLQGRTWSVSTPFGEQVGTDQQAWRPQTVQRWTWDGRLRDQLGVCGGLDLPWHADLSDAGWAVDLAADGQRTYVLDSHSLEARDGPGFPLWTWRPPVPDDGAADAARLVAVAADGGRIAVLDAGRRLLLLLDDQGAPLGSWPLAADGPAPVDLAMAADRIALLWSAPPRVELRDLAGGVVADWPLPDRPRALALDAQGLPWILGTGGWVWSLDGAGAVRAVFAAPAGRNAVDLVVGPDGLIRVAYARLSPMDPEGAEVLAAGIQVLRPIPLAIAPPLGPGCVILVDKSAAPRSLLLGEEVTVRLDQRGHCAPRAAPKRRLILLDHSRSMSWESTLERARAAVLALLDGLDPADGPVGLMGFGDDPTQLAPFEADRAALTAALMQLEPGGDTRLGAGLEGAAAALAAAGPSTLPSEVLVFTDGEYKDRLTVGLDALRAQGAGLRVVLVARASLDEATEAGLRRVVGSLGSVERLPPLPDQSRWLDGALGLSTPAEWGRDLRVVDELPDNMAYVAGSADPPARHDPAAGTLTWELPRAAAGEAPELRFRVRPLEAGTWPTNVRATLTMTDGWGLPQMATYPLPMVRVLDRADLTHRAWLPLVGGRLCWRARPVDLVLVIDASESMATPDGPAGERRIDLAVKAAQELLRDGVDPELDRVALVTFNATAHLAAPLGSDAATLRAALGAIGLASGTRLDAGLRAAAEALGARRPEALPAVILISDGRQTEAQAEVLSVAAALRAAGASLYTVGLGTDVDRGLLEALAGAPERYVPAPRAGDLAAALRDASERLLCGH